MPAKETAFDLPARNTPGNASFLATLDARNLVA
jgi:hypothetical protein